MLGYKLYKGICYIYVCYKVVMPRTISVGIRALNFLYIYFSFFFYYYYFFKYTENTLVMRMHIRSQMCIAKINFTSIRNF